MKAARIRIGRRDELMPTEAERAIAPRWFVFELPNGNVFCPAEDEDDAREKVAHHFAQSLRQVSASWPIVSRYIGLPRACEHGVPFRDRCVRCEEDARELERAERRRNVDASR